jgi:hypothetical protein
MRALKVDLYAGMSVAGGCVRSSHDRPHGKQKIVAIWLSGIKGKDTVYDMKFLYTVKLELQSPQIINAYNLEKIL